jgi:hypothetical protein
MSTMIVSTKSNREPFNSAYEDAICVATPLEAIMRLENRPIGTIVLAGEYAANPELAIALGELYPSVRIEREVADVAIR